MVSLQKDLNQSLGITVLKLQIRRSHKSICQPTYVKAHITPVHGWNFQLHVELIILANTARCGLSKRDATMLTPQFLSKTRPSAIRLCLQRCQATAASPRLCRTSRSSPNMGLSTLEDGELSPAEKPGSTWKEPCCPHLFWSEIAFCLAPSLPHRLTSSLPSGVGSIWPSQQHRMPALQVPVRGFNHEVSEPQHQWEALMIYLLFEEDCFLA